MNAIRWAAYPVALFFWCMTWLLYHVLRGLSWVALGCRAITIRLAKFGIGIRPC